MCMVTNNWFRIDVWKEVTLTNCYSLLCSFQNILDKCLWTDHDDVITWVHFPNYWSFVLRIHWSPVDSPHEMFSNTEFDIFFVVNLNMHLKIRFSYQRVQMPWHVDAVVSLCKLKDIGWWNYFIELLVTLNLSAFPIYFLVRRHPLWKDATWRPSRK